MRRLAHRVLPALLLAILALPGCATRPPASEPEARAEFDANNDPLEPLNRGLFFVHEGLDTLVLRPAAEAYRIFVPPPVRTGVSNVLANLRSPVILANDLLQGESARARITAERFLINTTLGLGGILDPATDMGRPRHTEDFGQTLAVWGVGEGFYLFLPGLGPSSLRDAAGFGVDMLLDPLFWITLEPGRTLRALAVTRTAATAVTQREALVETVDRVRRESLDPYATFRSGWRQQRERDIRNGRSE
ncbi:MAG: VacJ family lipoprotein [Acetobacteraceae bacterium]|nr:VacJ family lipoprotein [Acetobacteraceae bacterium]MDW8397882.1 VacJ family lipoprotein [Acetobacteraceae bacterium]